MIYYASFIPLFVIIFDLMGIELLKCEPDGYIQKNELMDRGFAFANKCLD